MKITNTKFPPTTFQITMHLIQYSFINHFNDKYNHLNKKYHIKKFKRFLYLKHTSEKAADVPTCPKAYS